MRSRCFGRLFAEVEADINWRQHRVLPETETPTPAYTLCHLSAGTDIHLRSGRRLCTLTLTAQNVLDVAYQSHLSRLKYAATFPLTGRHGFYNMGRNIALRLLFPF